ncbi:serine/threonine-protein kinase [Nannocystis punicea]|uniref:Serine/threonine-protein kinase n=1 Tax=Nannocystis punicea TaxID=2995304 RepID=A0ABY7GST8_9BACT|nr:serine/threonine-protein kinase [Nannocystis poenicansa]WAS90026.1 serine/threonine-protein kinase [Nannocystis poenicansa]
MSDERLNLLERIDEGRVKFELLGTTQSLARLGRFVVFARVGAGGMGVIYHAYDPELDRGVAIKLLHPAATAGGGRRRLLREARAMARLAHPNVVQVFEVGELEDHVYLVMEFVAGQTLRAWLAAAPRTWREIVAVFVQAADGLAATHAHGLVHCDFKPENVLIGGDGRARVGDFGLVHVESDALETSPVERVRAPELRSEGASTSTSMGGGTPRYMAPEQHAGRAADARSDQYGFCAALYEALAPAQFDAFVGAAPIGARSLQGQAPPLLAVAGAPPELGRLVARGLEPDPERRWSSMAALRVELARCARPRLGARGWRWGLAAGLVVGALAGVGYGFAAGGGAATCDAGAAQIEAVWGESQRRQVRAAIAATGLGFADDTAAQVEAQLEAYAEGWRATHRSACEAHRDGRVSDALFDRTMLCLATHRGALAGLVTQLGAIDAGALARATDAVPGLPELARCRDAELLLAEVPPPAEPTTAQAVLAVQSQLDAARSEWSLGRLDDATRHTAEALARAQAIGHAPLLAQALDHVGNFHRRREERAAAEAALTRALWLAAEIGDDERLGRVAGGLADVVALQGDRWSEARLLARLGRSMTQRTASGGRAHFEALYASGLVEHHAGRFAAAQAWYERALAQAEQHMDPGSEPALLARGMIALMLWERGEPEASLAQLERLCELQLAVFGPSHPNVATCHNNRAAILRQVGREDEALVGFSRALETWSAAYGPDHPDVGVAHGNIAAALLSRGRPEDLAAAEPHLRRAIATHERHFGPDDPELVVELSNLGSLHLFRLELDEAERQFTRALAISERAASDHPQAVLPLAGLGHAAALRGDFEGQRRYHERVLKIQESSLGPDHPELGPALLALAEAALHLGALDVAERHLERAGAVGVDRDERAALESLGLRGELALRRGDITTACELLARSLQGHEGRAFDFGAAERSYELARALAAAGQGDEARAAADRAESFYRRGGAALAWRVDAIEALQARLRDRRHTRADE